MAETAALTAEMREASGSLAARRLRREGKVPAILYGHKQDSVKLSISVTDIEALVRHGGHGLLEIRFNGTTESAVIKDLQWDALGKEILHVDFARVSKDEKVTVEVPIVLKGTAPGLSEGGMIDQHFFSIELECPGANIQEQVVINMNDLHVNQEVLVKDLDLGEGVRAVPDPELVVIQIVPHEEVEELPESIESPAEPELIRKEKGEEETGD